MGTILSKKSLKLFWLKMAIFRHLKYSRKINAINLYSTENNHKWNAKNLRPKKMARKNSILTCTLCFSKIQLHTCSLRLHFCTWQQINTIPIFFFHFSVNLDRHVQFVALQSSLFIKQIMVITLSQKFTLQMLIFHWTFES